MTALPFLGFQAVGENSRSIGKISSLPKSIQSERMIFEKPEYCEKLPTGPTIPSPGPMLLIVATTAVKLYSVVNPSIDISRNAQKN